MTGVLTGAVLILTIGLGRLRGRVPGKRRNF